MIKIYISNFHDVYTNIAIERYLFKTAQDDLILFLWDNKPCVVFGRNQNVYSEVNIDYANKNNISLVRRFSGGGAVFQDEGNLNYTFYLKDDINISKINDIILKTFANLNLNAYFSGRNDLLIDGKKFSGIAYCYDFDHIMYHGTCLINVDKNHLNKVLKPHDYKLISHSVDSYKSRVINLSEISNVSKNDVIASFIKTVKEFDEVEVINNIKINKEINEIIDYLKNKSYIFEDCPSYTYSLQLKLNHANYKFEVEYKNGEIINLNIFTDDLNIKLKDLYFQNLIHKTIPFNLLKDYIENIIIN